MADNNKFIAMLLEQETIDFEEIFSRFPEDEQEAFIDFLMDIQMAIYQELKKQPLEIKSEVIFQALKMIDPEMIKVLGSFLVQQEEDV